MKLINADYLTGRIFTEASLKNVNTCYESIMAIIESMESEDVLDKIRAEIADLDDADYDYEGYYKAITDAVQIIDKYRNEVSS